MSTVLVVPLQVRLVSEDQKDGAHRLHAVMIVDGLHLRLAQDLALRHQKHPGQGLHSGRQRHAGFEFKQGNLPFLAW